MWRDSAQHLIIAKRNVVEDINIFSPNLSKDLYPLSKNWYAASSVESEISRTWSYKLGDKTVLSISADS